MGEGLVLPSSISSFNGDIWLNNKLTHLLGNLNMVMDVVVYQIGFPL